MAKLEVNLESEEVVERVKVKKQSYKLRNAKPAC